MRDRRWKAATSRDSQSTVPTAIARLQAEALDLDPHHRQVLQLGHRDGRRAESALRLRDDQPVGGEARERLPDGAETDREAVAEILDLQPAAGRDAAGEQIGPHRFIGALRQVRPGVPAHEFPVQGGA